MLRSFADDSARLFWVVALDDEIMNGAVDLVKKHSLRTGDAIHLSSAMKARDVGKNLGFDLDIVASGLEPCRVAEKQGFRVLDPVAYPREDWERAVERQPM